MKREEIKKLFIELSKSQGFYGRLLKLLSLDEKNENRFYKELEEKNFKNSVDLILFIEG